MRGAGGAIGPDHHNAEARITGTRQLAFWRESKQTVTRNDRDVLHAIHHIGHRCHYDLPTQILVK